VSGARGRRGATGSLLTLSLGPCSAHGWNATATHRHLEDALADRLAEARRAIVVPITYPENRPPTRR